MFGTLISSPFTGAYYRKVSSPPARDVWGIRGEGRLPRLEFDPARQFVAPEGINHFTTGPLDRPSVYMGGHAAGQELDAGLSWDRVYDGGARATYTDMPNGCDGGDPAHRFAFQGDSVLNGDGITVATGGAAKALKANLKPSFAFRPFWRTTGTGGDWHNAKPGSAENIYFFPGEEIVMNLRAVGPDKVRMDIRSMARAGVHFFVSFHQDGFGRGAAQSFKRVNSIDQFRILENGSRKGNENEGIIPTRTRARGGGWQKVELLDREGKPLRPLAGDDVEQVVGEDVLAHFSKLFVLSSQTAEGGEVMDIVPA